MPACALAHMCACVRMCAQQREIHKSPTNSEGDVHAEHWPGLLDKVATIGWSSEGQSQWQQRHVSMIEHDEVDGRSERSER